MNLDNLNADTLNGMIDEAISEAAAGRFDRAAECIEDIATVFASAAPSGSEDKARMRESFEHLCQYIESEAGRKGEDPQGVRVGLHFARSTRAANRPLYIFQAGHA